ncbi:CPBP family intramembrane glutamic endopeptidase [Staphylococcus felis]|nr:CPBP family intramembrane glutamic endopeptidase [Staphylococcus felis]
MKMTQYRWKDIAWRDLWLIPIFIISQLILGMLVPVIYFFMTGSIEVFTDEGLVFNDTITYLIEIVSLVSYIIVVISFWLLHFKSMKQRFKLGIQGIKDYWKWIVVAYLIAMAASQAYGWIKEFLPEKFQYGTPQNEMLVSEMIHNLALLPVSFLFIAVFAPIVEEIIFRHILIGELGKKLNFKVMAVISVIIFAAFHVTNASSPFEIVDYLIIAIPLVWLYLKSNRNLGVTIGFHILNNFLAFVLELLL